MHTKHLVILCISHKLSEPTSVYPIRKELRNFWRGGVGAMAHLCWLLSIITIFNQKAIISSIVPHSKSKAYQLSKTFVVTCADPEGG